MMPLPDEASRRPTLSELRNLGTASQEQFDTLVRLISRQLQCPIAWLGLLDDETGLWLKAQVGLASHELPTFAGTLMSTLLATEGLVIRDGLAAAATVVVNGKTVGMVRAMDTAARTFDDEALAALRDLAAMAAFLVDSRLNKVRWRQQETRVRAVSMSNGDQVQTQHAARKAERLLSDALDSLTTGVMITDPSGQVVMTNPVWRHNIGHNMSDGAPWSEIVQRMAQPATTPMRATVRSSCAGVWGWRRNTASSTNCAGRTAG